MTTPELADSAWFELLQPHPPGPVVVALPYAGGAGWALRPLRGHLSSQYGLALVDLPGHGRRMAEPCLRDPDQVVAGLLAALPALPATRLVLLGHSLGGWLAYELAVRLTEAGAAPAGLVVCGSRAPQTGMAHPPLAHLPEEQFLPAAVDYGVAAREMLEMPGLAEAFATALHADLSMVENYRHRLRPPLPVPVCVVGFGSDWLVPEPSLRAWDDLCQDPPLHRRVAGGHLSVREREFGEAVRDGIAHVLGFEKETP